jgi:polar amino acid transport system permease protein
MDLIIESLPLFFRGFLVTLQLAFVTLFLTTIASALLGLMRVSSSAPLRYVSLAAVEFFRDIPLVVNLLFVYFGAPILGIPLEPFWSAVVSLTSWGAANGAEIVRGGFNAIPKHQRETAMALGLSRWEILRYVIGPQVILPILPPYTGLLSILIQATSLASLVGAMEFFRMAQIIVERTTLMTGYSPAFTVFGFVLCVYFCVCFSLAMLTRYLERRLAEPSTRRGIKVQGLQQQAAESI